MAQSQCFECLSVDSKKEEQKFEKHNSCFHMGEGQIKTRKLQNYVIGGVDLSCCLGESKQTQSSTPSQLPALLNLY